MRAHFINEDILDDEDAERLATWMTDPRYIDTTKKIVVPEPFSITFKRNEEYAKFTMILQKYHIPFEEVEPATNESIDETLRFSDGEEFDTSGPLRTEKRYDGWYVIGNGMLIPVDSKEEGEEYIQKRKK